MTKSARIMAVLVATAALGSTLGGGCSSSSSSTPASAPSASSSPSAAGSASPAPAAFVGTWRSSEGNVLVVAETDSDYLASLYTDGGQPLQDTMRERAASLISVGFSSAVRWKLSWDTDLGQLVLSDKSRGDLMFTRVSSSTASPSAQQ